MKITDLIKASAGQLKKHVAIYDKKGSWSYEQLWLDVKRRAAELKLKGIRSGMGVGVMGQNSREFITSVLAVMHVDAVVFPISHNLKPEEIKKLCQRTKLHFLWDDKSTSIPMEEESADDLLNWRWSKNDYAKPVDQLIDFVEQPALVRFTSGTTGKSKGVVLSHQSIIERTAAANEILDLDNKDTVIWVLSMAYHFVVSILLYLRYGASICICESFMGDHILQRTNELNGTFLYVSPMHVRMLIKEKSGELLPSLKRVISTSMAIEADLCDQFHEKFNLPITQAFGIIEIGLPVINTRSPGSSPASIGYPLPAYDVAILSESGMHVENGMIGQLAIRGPGMFDAYLDPPLSREKAMDFGYFLTGDLASQTDDGRIAIAGRKKNVINVSGNKAFPEEVETVINQFPGVDKSRVKGFKHPLLHECVMAEVVKKPSAKVEVEQLITYCRQRLSTYKVPQRIIFVDEIKMTDSGKISRH